MDLVVLTRTTFVAFQHLREYRLRLGLAGSGESRGVSESERQSGREGADGEPAGEESAPPIDRSKRRALLRSTSIFYHFTERIFALYHKARLSSRNFILYSRIYYSVDPNDDSRRNVSPKRGNTKVVRS